MQLNGLSQSQINRSCSIDSKATALYFLGTKRSRVTSQTQNANDSITYARDPSIYLIRPNQDENDPQRIKPLAGTRMLNCTIEHNENINIIIFVAAINL